MQREGAAVTYGGRLFHRRAAVTVWTDEYVERPETLKRQNVVVVWFECLLVDIVRWRQTASNSSL